MPKENSKIIPLYPQNTDESIESEFDFENEDDDFESWEAEAAFIEEEDWEGLIEYYKKRIATGQVELCIEVADVYIDLKQYNKAIEFLQPFYKQDPENEVIKSTINKAHNYLDKKDIFLQQKDFKLMGGTDMFRLFYDDNLRRINKKKFKDNLSELFKQYEYICVDIHDNIYGVKNNKKEFLKKEDEAYSTANDLIE